MSKLPPLLLSFEKLHVDTIDGKFEKTKNNRSKPYSRTENDKKWTTLSNGFDLVKQLIQKARNAVALGPSTWNPSYLQLLQKIKDTTANLWTSVAIAPDKQLYKAAIEIIREFWATKDAEFIFEPSYQARYRTSPEKGIGVNVAEQLTMGYFEAKEAAPFATISQREQMRFEEYKAWQLAYENGTQEFRNKWSSFEKERRTDFIARIVKSASQKDSEASRRIFVRDNADTIDRLVRDAVNSFLSIPGNEQAPLLSAFIRIQVQELNTLNIDDYRPIAAPLHMDNETDRFRDGTRYGRPASEQEVQSLVASFCANLVPSIDGTKKAVLDSCGTVYFDAVPVVKFDVMLGLVEAMKNKYPQVAINTDYEIISELGAIFSDATTEALSNYSEIELKEMGISSTQAERLKWSNVNALTFHRSASIDEVKANSIRNSDGSYMPRLRVFSVFFANPDFETGFGAYIINIPNVVDKRGRQIKTQVSIVFRD